MTKRLRHVNLGRGDGGYSLIETLTVLMIMGVVLTGLTTVFVSGSKAQTNMNQRFQAQQSTRLALDRIRRDIHCSYDVSPNTPNPWTAAASTVTLKSTGCGDVTWCAVPMTGSTTRWSLYRQSGLSCSSAGKLFAEYLTTANVFTAFSHPAATLAGLTVDFPVKTASAAGTYRLTDKIYLRNSTRT